MARGVNAGAVTDRQLRCRSLRIRREKSGSSSAARAPSSIGLRFLRSAKGSPLANGWCSKQFFDRGGVITAKSCSQRRNLAHEAFHSFGTFDGSEAFRLSFNSNKGR
jgi:hypothetical protein